jgi:uncharacterized integral membrane protein
VSLKIFLGRIIRFFELEIMRTIANLLNSLIMAGWVGAIAIFSIQNIQAVSVRFLGFQSLQLPVGVLLAFFAGIGMVLGSLLPLLWQRRKRVRRSY